MPQDKRSSTRTTGAGSRTSASKHAPPDGRILKGVGRSEAMAGTPAAGATPDQIAQIAALRRRVVIESVQPEVDEGRYPAKRGKGETVVVEADVYTDGHDAIAADLLYREEGASGWKRVRMTPLVNDRWRAAFLAGKMTTYVYTIEAWLDHFAQWQEDLAKKVEAEQDVSVDLLVGAAQLAEAAERAPSKDADVLRNASAKLRGKTAVQRRAETALDPELGARMREVADRRFAARYRRELRLQVDSPQAVFSTWYEMFPRSASPDPKRPGTFRDVEKRLSYVAGMGFDVLYLPPIHPIGQTKRKGANNAMTAKRGDPGSPWAIGGKDGGHKSVNPELGTLEDFRRLVKKAKEKGISVALDIAFQCSPDHPYVKEHPDWFWMRPDGTVQYAENPPKKYEDIFPFNFDTEDWEALWAELRSVFMFWMEQGVRVFRVDNPHTKPFRFWEWVIGEVRKADPGVIFLSEAFTRPKIMYNLAKLGFTQGYTYFAWRYSKQELTDYFTELSQPPVSDFFRPNAWPNTPDILTEQLQTGGRPAFIQRAVLAATLSASYGMYGPPFELMEREPREPGSEEYLHSEKYEVRQWEIGREDSLSELIGLVNKARKENPALQRNTGLRFHQIENDRLLVYSKQSEDGGNVVLCVVNLDLNFTQSGWVWLPIEDWGIGPEEPYQVHDLMSDARHTWQGPQNYVELNPHVLPAHVFRLRRRTGGKGWEFE